MAIHEDDMRSLKASGLTPEIINERGYFSADMEATDITPKLAELGAKWSRSMRESLVIPMYGPKGDLVSAQIRLREIPEDTEKPFRYLTPRGMGHRLDVHPRNVSRIPDVSQRLWITEGVKKGDALTVHGEVTISLAGIFTWRNKLGTLGEWEDVPLRNREVIVCFDSDAREKRSISQAMERLGKWLKSKGAKVLYLVTPEIPGLDKTGADDFLANGGTIADLLNAATDHPPVTVVSGLTDSAVAETVADEVLADRYAYFPNGSGWMKWSGKVWEKCDTIEVRDEVRLWAKERFVEAATKYAERKISDTEFAAWKSLNSRSRLDAVVDLSRGILKKDARLLDNDPDLLNVQNGIVNLRTGELMAHDPEKLMSKLANAEYDPNATHPDWDASITAIPESVRDWFQVRIGQAATGYAPPDDKLIVLHGGGRNGKTTIMTGVGKALGNYHVMASDSILMGDAKRDETIALMGARICLTEETPEAGRLNSTQVKKMVGSEVMEGKHLYQSRVTWDVSHSPFLNTNFRPIVSETDEGTWERLALVTFPYRFTSNPEAPHERKGDPTIRQRVKTDPEVHKAVLRWIVDGAKKFYADGGVMPDLPESIIEDTREWRRASDMILSFWDDQLEADRDSHVNGKDLWAHYRSWMEAQSNKPGSEKLFVARFSDHSETVSARVTKRRIRPGQADVGRLSLPIGISGQPSGQYQAWLGVRFREDDDPMA